MCKLKKDSPPQPQALSEAEARRRRKFFCDVGSLFLREVLAFLEGEFSLFKASAITVFDIYL